MSSSKKISKMNKTIKTMKKKISDEEKERIEMINAGYKLISIIEVEMIEKGKSEQYTYREIPVKNNTPPKRQNLKIPVEVLSFKELVKKIGATDAKEFREICLEMWPVTQEIGLKLIDKCGIKNGSN